MEERLVHIIRGYGSSRKSYGCFSLACGVTYWSLSSLFLGIGLLLFISLVDWKTQDVLHFSFAVQNEIRATLNLGRPGHTLNKEGPLALSGEYDEQIAALNKEMANVAIRLDWWIKRIVWWVQFKEHELMNCLQVLRFPLHY